MFNVPVLVIVYNRMFEAHNLFQIIRQVQPAKLYVASDGPVANDQQDCADCFRTRTVFMPEWPCELRVLNQEEHLGKSPAIHKAMKWFFEQEKEGIILFEDCIPHLDFFPYCAELLDRFRDDKRIFHIGASNFRKHHRAVKHKAKQHDDCSYYFSAYATTWGFATWADRWEDFDMDINELEQVNFNKLVKHYTRRPKERRYWHRRYTILRKTELPVWDYQYNFHIWLHSGLAVSPTLNLVTNVGVHPQGSKRKFRRLIKKSYPIMPLKHPTEIIPDQKDDKFMFRNIYSKAYIHIFANWINDMLGAKQEESER